MIVSHPVNHIIEIVNGTKPEGLLCGERILVGISDEGGGPFITLKTENLDPSDTYDEGTITMEFADARRLLAAIAEIIKVWESK